MTQEPVEGASYLSKVLRRDGFKAARLREQGSRFGSYTPGQHHFTSRSSASAGGAEGAVGEVTRIPSFCAVPEAIRFRTEDNQPHSAPAVFMMIRMILQGPILFRR